MTPLLRTLHDIIDTTSIPSLSLNIRVDGHEVAHHTLGLARLHPATPAREDQAYDLASVTKALAGSTVAASLVQERTLSLHKPVADVLDGVDPRITLAHLLTHSSGLPAWNAFYREPKTAWGTDRTRRAILKAARTTAVGSEPGSSHTYTDIGFLTLLDLIETATGQRIDRLFQERILGPAGVRDMRWGWPEAAATEDCPERGRVVVGTVHDLNCASLGGASTHAGLFATARAVSALAEALLDAVQGRGSGDLPGRGLAELWALRGAGTHAGGWDTITQGGYTSTGKHFPPDTVGHLGYTGTSLWLSPSKRAIVTLLTNRVHPIDDKATIRAVRPRVHNAVAHHLGWV